MTDPERVEAATRSFLDDYPDLEDALQTLLEHEHETGAWTFDDTSLDSGRFGELVSREFITQTDDGSYRFVNRATVEAVLVGDSEAATAPTATTESGVDISLPDIDARLAGAFTGGLALVVAIRSMYYSTVFQNGHVVSPANDPYFYRYWQERLLDHGAGPTDLGMFATVGEETRIRPLSHWLNWWVTELLGGTPDAAGTVAAAQPIVASVLLAVVIYALVVTLTADHRIALTAVVLFAMTPVLVVYTALGFLEHRPYQYLWLGLNAFSLVWLAVDLTHYHRAGHESPELAHARNLRAWVVAGILAFGIAATAHTWGGSPLSFVPVAVYFALRVVADCRAKLNSVLANAPALAGVGLGSLFALAAHLRWGWHESIAVTVPVALAAGSLLVAGLATVWLRFEQSPRSLLAAEGLLGGVGTVLFWQLRPEDVARLQQRSSALFDRDTATEATSLLTTDHAVVLGPLFQIGIGFYFALIALGFATYYVARNYQPAWLVVVCFTWFWFALAAIQGRFAAQLAILTAGLGAVGIVYALSRVDLVREPAIFARDGLDGPPLKLPRTPRTGGYLVGTVALILLFNLIFVPTLLGQTQHSEEKFTAALTIDEHADSLESEHSEFVLSRWGDNRMYNYFVTGESRGYGYALSNHDEFIASTDPDEQYDQHSGRVGYVVLREFDGDDVPPEATHHKLFDEFGAGNESVAHYRLIYTASDVRAFALVEGATIDVSADPDTNVTASVDVAVMDESFTYERTARTDDDGSVSLRVAYPGEYVVGEETVTVTESDVYNGTAVTPEE